MTAVAEETHGTQPRPAVPAFSILPLRGLSFVALAIAGVIAAIASNELWALNFFHVVGVMATIALTYLEPANLAVLFELKKPQPDGRVIDKLMKRFVYTAGITGAMQVATLVIMTRLAS